jgi:hypothetical protein
MPLNACESTLSVVRGSRDDPDGRWLSLSGVSCFAGGIFGCIAPRARSHGGTSAGLARGRTSRFVPPTDAGLVTDRQRWRSPSPICISSTIPPHDRVTILAASRRHPRVTHRHVPSLTASAHRRQDRRCAAREGFRFTMPRSARGVKDKKELRPGLFRPRPRLRCYGAEIPATLPGA